MSSEEKPLITISGNQSLVSEQLSQQISRDLPQEGVEWQRSYGRTSKIVYLEAKLVPLEDQHLANDTNELQLLPRPLLHTYWTDCPDVDTYKSQAKDEIQQWLNRLKECQVTDWFLIHVENSGDRKGINKSKLLPTIKTSVLDRIRTDFPMVKASTERTISLLESRSESKTSDSYQQLMSRLRSLLLHSYSKQLLRYEDYIRTMRENRNAKNWHFLEFFRLQEELAFAFEMLSLYDEALVQYDELDALFSQFVINSNAGPMPHWLAKLAQHSDQWHGLCLSSIVHKDLRQRLRSADITLIELRNYLFGRQSELLFLLNKPWELASRALPFLQNCVNELNILEISVTEGGIACWVFLSALEILHKCERYSDSSQMDSYSRHTVGLWSYARNKLSELGSLCGLMPVMTMTSEHLQKVVDLIAGMGTDPRIGEVPMSPQERLKEALSGQEAFLKHYFEISELTMGTYKHIGRMRFARLIGKELSQLYIQLLKPQKAMPFLLDLEKVYLKEKWPQLLNEIRLLLLSCYQMTSDSRREFRIRCQLSANDLLDDSKRLEHCLEAEKLLETIGKNTKECMNIRMEGILEIQDIALDLEDNYTVTNREVQLNLKLVNNFPKEIHCKRLLVSLRAEQKASNFNLSKHKTAVNGCPHMSDPVEQNTIKASDASLIREKPSISTFHSSISVGLKCQNTGRLLLRRSDSLGFALQDKEPEVSDTHHSFVINDLTLKPGVNDIGLTYKTKESATYVVNQIVVNWTSSANLITTDIVKHICFAVIAEEPSLKVLQLTTIEGLTNDILCGVEQSVVLELNTGSSSFPEGTPLTIKASRGLKIKLETDLSPTPLSDQIQVPLGPALNPFETFEIPIVIKSKTFPQKDANSVEQDLTMCWPMGQDSAADRPSKPISVTFQLLAPFVTSYKLHTCAQRKFLEVLVTGLSKQAFVVSEPRLTVPKEMAERVELEGRLPKCDSTLSHGQTIHFVWEMIAKSADSVINRLTFRLKYKLLDEKQTSGLIRSQWEEFECEHKLQNYETLYTLKECIEPLTGTEFCRAGTLCHLNVRITRVKASDDHNSIMYEIISDQSLWSLSGKTAGVVAIDGQSDTYEVTFEVMPLISGFLPLPTIRLSKYISTVTSGADPTPVKSQQSQQSQQSEAKLLAFDSGQVYNWSRATQVHVLPSSQLIAPEA